MSFDDDNRDADYRANNPQGLQTMTNQNELEELPAVPADDAAPNQPERSPDDGVIILDEEGLA